MEIVIVGPSLWRPALDRALARVPEASPEMALALLRFMHDRHVGIAPLPAVRLAALLGATARRDGDDLPDLRRTEPWGDIVDRLALATTPDETTEWADRLSRPRRLASLRLGSIPTWAVTRIAIPLVWRACDLMGLCYLFGGHGHAVSRKIEAGLAHFESQQSEMLLQLATASDDMLELFWDEQGFAAGALSRGAVVQALRDYPERLPSLDQATFALLWRLRPTLAGLSEQERKRIPRTARLAFRRAGDRPKEDGVAGIRVSRRLDDLDELSHSEHINAGLVLLDRLVNTGFLIRHRPPRRQRRRDCLIVGFMPDPEHGPSCALAKASWFELILRLGVVLQAASLTRSDFLWVEAGRLGSIRSYDAALDMVAPAPLDLISDVPHSYRMQALIELGWMPKFLDRKAFYVSAVPAPGASALSSDEGRLHAYGGWMAGAMGNSLRLRGMNHGPQDRDADTGWQPSDGAGLSDYRLVHGFVCWPYDPAKDGERSSESDLAHLAERLGFAREHGQSLSLLRVPHHLRDRGNWRLSAERRADLAIAADDDRDRAGTEFEDMPPDTAGLSAGLIQAWLGIVVEALFGD